MSSESPAPSQEMLESKIRWVRKPDLNKSPTSIPNSVEVCQAEREPRQKPRSNSQANTPGAVLLVPSAALSGFPAVSQPPPQINEANKVWVQSEGEPRSEQGMSRRAFWRQST